MGGKPADNGWCLSSQAISDWTPQQKRSRGRSRKRCKDCVGEDFKTIGRRKSWKREALNRVKWREIIEEAKTH